jgi:uncharacterized protein YdiU (UPF0061 family)
MHRSLAAFSNTYARLPERFHARLAPTPVAQPRLLALNRPLAGELGLDLEGLDDAALAAVFAGNVVPAGAEPLSTAYAGHQFGHFVPQLGDGRAILLGEVIDRRGVRREIQLKGAGRTPYSRRGDGRAALGPVLREYLVSEAMAALGIPATRALAAVATGEPVFREERLPGAVLTRVARSHVRVGTFQYFAAREDEPAIAQLTAHVIEHLYPELYGAERPGLALLRAVAQRQAALIARWMQVGFVHGVMNTDNMSVAGETIDFGPCAFMEAYDPATVFSAIDEYGRYAYGNQPHIAQWNLTRLAECLLGAIDPEPAYAAEQARAVLSEFADLYEQAWTDGMRAKLGLASALPGDRALVEDLLEVMRAGGADFTLCFRRLCDAAEDDGPVADPGTGTPRGPASLFADPQSYLQWQARWHQRLRDEPAAPAQRAGAMRTVNPAFIPRNHRVEQALAAATEAGDLAPFERLMAVLARPYDDQPEHAAYAAPAQPQERVLRTFCGT